MGYAMIPLPRAVGRRPHVRTIQYARADFSTGSVWRNVMSPTDRLRGSFPPLAVPFKNGDVDYDTYARIVSFHIENGSHGLLVNGTTGEPATLSVAERNKLVDVAIQVAAKRVPVVAATGSQSLFETQELTEHA